MTIDWKHLLSDEEIDELAGLQPLESLGIVERPICEIEDCSRMYIGSAMTKPEIIKVVNSKERLK